jgi:ubiquinone/menaquinone biosynthesis C-methylase UbiE
MLHHNQENEWEKMGSNDPYYGVLVNDKFRRNSLDKTALSEFFQSGSDHIEYMFKTIRSSIDKNFSPSKALCFGCGVGRCLLPLAQVCDSAVGVDISTSMLDEARKNAENFSLSNVELVKSDDQLSQVSGKFDYINSFSTFQHISQKRGYAIFQKLIDLLVEGGTASLEFIYYREKRILSNLIGNLRKYAPFMNNVFNLIYRRPFLEPLMEKNAYDLTRLLRILHENKCHNVHLQFFNNGKFGNVIIMFQKKPVKVPLVDILSA